MSVRFLYIGNDTTIAFNLLDVNGVAATGATMEATLYSGSSAVTGQTWPLPLGETSPGTYSGVLTAALAITDGQALRLVVTATHNGSTARWENVFQGAVRRATGAT